MDSKALKTGRYEGFRWFHGRLISIRISDYAWMEKEIDWQQTGTTEEEARKVNAVREFPAGVGRKPQEIL